MLKLGIPTLSFLGDVLNDTLHGGGIHMLQVNEMVPIKPSHFKAFLNMVPGDLWFTSFCFQFKSEDTKLRLLLSVVCFSSGSSSKADILVVLVRGGE